MADNFILYWILPLLSLEWIIFLWIVAFLTSSYRVVYFCLFIQLDHLAGFHQDQPHTHLDPTQGLAIVSEFCVWFIPVSGQLSPWTICPRQLAPDLQTNGRPIWKHLCYFGQIYFYAQKVIISWKKKKVCFLKYMGLKHSGRKVEVGETKYSKT